MHAAAVLCSLSAEERALTCMRLAPGDGFVTDEAIISANGLSDPNGFFEALLTRPYVNQVSQLLP